MPDREPDPMPALHPALAPLAWLVGSWQGLGVGGYPGIASFRYEEQAQFSHDGRPFLSYRSRTWLIGEDGNRLSPAHGEDGFWRLAGTELEVVLAHPTGIVEVYLGEVGPSRAELATDVVARTASAREVAALRRLYGLVEEDLAYAVDLAASGHPLQPHLSARLSRRPDRQVPDVTGP